MLVDCLLDQGHAGLDSRSSSSGRFELRTRARDEKGFSRSEKSADKTLLSFVAPQGGMFVWLRVHVSEHREYGRKSTQELVMELWELIAQAKVLIAPGTMVRPSATPLARANGSSSPAVRSGRRQRRRSSCRRTETGSSDWRSAPRARRT